MNKYSFIVFAIMGTLYSSIDIPKLKCAWELSKKSKATNVNDLVKRGLDNIPYYSLRLPH